MIKLIKNIFSTQKRIILSKDGLFYPQVKKFIFFWCNFYIKNLSYTPATFDIVSFSTKEEAMSYLEEKSKKIQYKSKEPQYTVVWKSV